jgi:hypothetical protein
LMKRMPDSRPDPYHLPEHGAAKGILFVGTRERQRHYPGDHFGLYECSHLITLKNAFPLQATLVGFAYPTSSRNPTSRPRISRSASAIIQSISSLTVGMSLIKPTTTP